jgi:glycosyltransferase involved in cell wall biosynthesis
MDLLFLPLEKSNSLRHRNLFIPSKLFEYIAINKPILGLCEDSEAKEILEHSGLGKNIDPENENELVNYLHQLILNPNLLGQFKRNDEVIMQFSAETATQKLANVFNQI